MPMKYARLYKGMSLLVMLLVVAGCTVSYKFNGASINYDIVKTISIENFPNRAVYQWGPMESMFNNALSDIYVNQTKLQQVNRGGDLMLSGEITAYDQVNKSISSDGYSISVNSTVPPLPKAASAPPAPRCSPRRTCRNTPRSTSSATPVLKISKMSGTNIWFPTTTPSRA